MPEITDEFILSLFSNEKTKEKAFELLLKKYQKHIYYNARRIVTIHEDADDVTQNVCIKIWKNLDRFRNESSLKTWISRICVNESLTYIEKKKKMLNLDDDESYTDFLLKTHDDFSTVTPNQIEQFLQDANPGFSSRFTDRMHIEDYTPEQLKQILVSMAKKKKKGLSYDSPIIN